MAFSHIRYHFIVIVRINTIYFYAYMMKYEISIKITRFTTDIETGGWNSKVSTLDRPYFAGRKRVKVTALLLRYP
jgi:hypothetical protein